MKFGTGLVVGAGAALAWLTGCSGGSLSQDESNRASAVMPLMTYGNLFGVRAFAMASGVLTETPYYGAAALSRVTVWGFPVQVEDQNENSRNTSVRLSWADGTKTGWTPIADNTANTSFLQHNNAGQTAGHTFNLIKVNGVWEAWATAGIGSGLTAVEAFYGNPLPTLAVVTTNDVVANSKMLGAYVAFKRQSQATIIVTEDKTYRANGTTNSSGWATGITLPQPTNWKTTEVRADAIYGWLKANSRLLGLTDLLLVGDPDPLNGDLPMKNLWVDKTIETIPAKLNDKGVLDGYCLDLPVPTTFAACTKWRDKHDLKRSLPTDYYYSNFGYVWPKDADGDIVDISKIDFLHQDLNVGRVPIKVKAEDPNRFVELDSILVKFINYASSTDTAWRKNALLAMDTHGGVTGTWVPFGEAIRDQLLTPSGFGSYRVYIDFTAAQCDAAKAADPGFDAATCKSYLGRGELRPTSETNVGSVWAGSAWSGCSGAVCSQQKRNFGIVTWATHGGSDGAGSVISLSNGFDYFRSLDDSHPAFVAAAACNNSQPDTDGYATNDNVGAALLRKGAIGTLGATRISWPAHYNHYDTVHLYGLDEVGEHDVTYGFINELVKTKLTAGQALSALRIRLGSTVVLTGADNKVGYAAQLVIFNLYGDPTIGLENLANANVIALPSRTATNVTLAANKTVTLFATDWPSKGETYQANVWLSVNSLTGKPIPSGSVWVNGKEYGIGGATYNEFDIADQGPYTIEISTTAATTVLLTLGQK